MTLRERQDQFTSDLEMFDDWTGRFDYLISLSGELLPVCPEHLLPFRIEFCKSKTCFKPMIQEDMLYISGWSNSPVLGGIIVAMRIIFNFTSRDEFLSTDIDFHTKSGLIENLTPLRRDGIMEMIRRITVLLK